MTNVPVCSVCKMDRANNKCKSCVINNFLNASLLMYSTKMYCELFLDLHQNTRVDK